MRGRLLHLFYVYGLLVWLFKILGKKLSDEFNFEFKLSASNEPVSKICFNN